MSVESDGIGESFDEQMRIGAMAAMQVGERIARTLAEQRRRTQEQTQQETARQQQRLDAERRSALVDLAVVRNSDWWKDAQPEEIADKYALARGFRDEDPEIARHEEFMRGELKQRYGIDTNERQDVDPKALQDEIQRIETNRADPARQLETGDAAATHREQLDRATQDERAATDREQAREFDERAKAAEQRARESERQAETETDPDRSRELHEQAARDQQEAETLRGDANHSYDSAERRNATAGTMREQGGDQQQIDTAMRNDIAQGRPAHDAVRDVPGRKQTTAQGRSQSPVRGRPAQRTR